jgi:hypothetical protein
MVTALCCRGRANAATVSTQRGATAKPQFNFVAKHRQNIVDTLKVLA